MNAYGAFTASQSVAVYIVVAVAFGIVILGRMLVRR